MPFFKREKPPVNLYNSLLSVSTETSDSKEKEPTKVIMKESKNPEDPQPSETLFSKAKNYILNYYIHPEGKIRIVFDFIMTFIILYNAILVPYLICFESYISVPFNIVNIILDVVGWFNILAHLLEPKMRGADPEKVRGKRFLSYWKNLLVDILTYCTIFDWFLTQYPYLRLPRVIPFVLLRFSTYYATIEQKSGINPVQLRIIKSSIYLMIILHWFSCLFFLEFNLYHEHGNILIQVDNTDNLKYLVFMNVAQKPGDYEGSVRIRQYLGSFYFATVFMVGFATDVPQDEIGALYSILNAAFGVLFVAGIVGVVSNLFGQMNQLNNKFNQRVDDVTGYLKFRKVDKTLISDSREFLNIIRRAHRELKTEEDILDDLETETKRKVSLFLHQDIVSKVAMFNQCGEMFVQDICMFLEHTVVLKGYNVITAGETGREMFFLGKGSVEIVLGNGVVVATLVEGQFFGEVALLMNAKRNASIRAKEICELYILHKEDFDLVLGKYPEAKKIMQQEAEKRTLSTQSVSLKAVVKFKGIVKKQRSSKSVLPIPSKIKAKETIQTPRKILKKAKSTPYIESFRCNEKKDIILLREDKKEETKGEENIEWDKLKELIREQLQKANLPPTSIQRKVRDKVNGKLRRYKSFIKLKTLNNKNVSASPFVIPPFKRKDEKENSSNSLAVPQQK
ncbi:hypothetical protein ABK040_004865 [Willaertia magna]